MKARLLLFSLLFCATSAAHAAKGMKLVYHHSTGMVESRTFGDKQIDATSVGSGERLDLRGGRSVPVWIDDPNPVVFTYKWEDLTFEKNANYAAALEFAKTISPINVSLGGKAERGTTTFAEQVGELQRIVDSMPQIARLTLGTQDDVKLAKTTVAGWNLPAIRKTVDTFYSELQKANFGAAAGTGITTGVDPNTGFSGTDPLANASTNKTDAAAKNEPAQATTPAAPAPAKNSGNSSTAISNEVLRAALAERGIRTMLESAETFASSVAQVNKSEKLGEVPYDMKQDPTAHIKIGVVPGFEEIAKDSGRATGSVDIPLQPYYPAAFSVGPSLVYSFVERSDFTAEKQENGKFKIVEGKKEYAGTNVSAMFSITPRGWDEPTLGGAFQIGISPVKDQIGFFGGGQLRITDLIALGVGYAYQQVPRLGDGLSLDKEIDSEKDLKTNPDFEGGWYLSFDIKLPK